MKAPHRVDSAALLLSAAIAGAVVAHAREGYPNEVCGLIAGRAGSAAVMYRGRNVSATPRVAYELDPETLARQIDFEDAGLELVAIYHSHPRGPSTPSPSDVAQAFYPDSVYLICSLSNPARPRLRGFRITDGSIREVKVLDADATHRSGILLT